MGTMCSLDHDAGVLTRFFLSLATLSFNTLNTIISDAQSYSHSRMFRVASRPRQSVRVECDNVEYVVACQ